MIIMVLANAIHPTQPVGSGSRSARRLGVGRCADWGVDPGGAAC
jgi:hypothetical protein